MPTSPMHKNSSEVKRLRLISANMTSPDTKDNPSAVFVASSTVTPFDAAFDVCNTQAIPDCFDREYSYLDYNRGNRQLASSSKRSASCVIGVCRHEFESFEAEPPGVTIHNS